MAQSRMSLVKLGSLLGRLYDAALDYGKWRDALKEIHEMLRANSVIFILRPDTKKSPGLSMVFIDDMYEFADLIANTPGTSPFDSMPLEQVITVADLISDQEWLASSFYRKVCEPYDVYDVMCLNLSLADGSVLRIRITRSKSEDNFSSKDKEFLSLLAPHIRRAFDMQMQRMRNELVHSQYVEACDRMGVATFILDGGGNLLEYNKLANALLRDGDGLTVAQGKLGAIHSSSNRELHHLIAKALNYTKAMEAPLVSEVMPVVRLSGRANLGLLVQSMPSGTLHAGRRRPAITVFVRDPELRTAAPFAITQRLFNLTQTETALALELVNGLSLEEAAEALKISRNTARSHLRAIFGKTGVKRQSTLIRIILNSIMPLCAGDPILFPSRQDP